MTITVTFDSSRVLAGLQRLHAAGADMTLVMEGIGKTVVDLIHGTLGQGLTPWGAAMEPLKYRKGVPLNNTRQHIFNRLTYRAYADSVHVGLFDSEGNKIGRVHQFGSSITRAAHSREVNFKVNMKTGQLRFAKLKNANFAQTVQYPEQVFKIPPRPFLPLRGPYPGIAELPAEWMNIIGRIAERKIMAAFRGMDAGG